MSKKNAKAVTKKTTKSVAKKVVAPKATTKTKAVAVEAKSTTNPYRVGGGYWATVEALRSLGLGKMHSFDAMVPAVIRAMGAEAYKAFKAKDARNEETGKDATARIIQNASVVARKDYGKPLVECGYEVRFDGRTKVCGLYKL